MIKLVNIKKSDKEKDVIIVYNTVNIKSKKGDFKLLMASQIDITKINPEDHSYILNIINKYYNKNTTIDLLLIKTPIKKKWWQF